MGEIRKRRVRWSVAALSLLFFFIFAGCNLFEDIPLRARINDITTVDPVYEWVPVIRLVPPIPEAGEQFGYAVSVTDEFAAVGAYDNGSLHGKVFLFQKSTGWSYLEAKTGEAANDRFGWSLSLSGSTLLVGAPGRSSQTGAAYLFEWNGSSWSIPTALSGTGGKLDNPCPSGSNFGHAAHVAGGYACVGAPYDPPPTYTGAAFAFSSTDNWARQLYDMRPSISGEIYAGFAVAISAGYALLGAPRDDEVANNAGAVYLHTKGANWPANGVKKTEAGDVASAYSGTSVSISGLRAVVGVPGDALVRVYDISAGNLQNPVPVEVVDGQGDDLFGESVGISGDYLIVGSPNYDAGSQLNAGRAHIFERKGTWTLVKTVVSASPVGDDKLGKSVCVSGDLALIGAPGEGGSGAAYLFERRRVN